MSVYLTAKAHSKGQCAVLTSELTHLSVHYSLKAAKLRRKLKLTIIQNVKVRNFNRF